MFSSLGNVPKEIVAHLHVTFLFFIFLHLRKKNWIKENISRWPYECLEWKQVAKIILKQDPHRIMFSKIWDFKILKYETFITFNCTNKFRYLCDTKVSEFDLLKIKTTCSISPNFLHLFGPLDIYNGGSYIKIWESYILENLKSSQSVMNIKYFLSLLRTLFFLASIIGPLFYFFW